MSGLYKIFLTCLTLVFIFSFSCSASDEASFGCDISDMISYGGKMLNTDDGTYYADDNYGGCLFFQKGSESELISEQSVRCLNLIDNKLYFVSQQDNGSAIFCMDTDTNEIIRIKENLPSEIGQMYVSREKTAYFNSGDNIYLYDFDSDELQIAATKQNLISFVPTEYGFIYAIGEPLNFSLFAEDTLLCEKTDGYSINTENGYIVFTENTQDKQIKIDSAFNGNTKKESFTGLGSVDMSELFSENMTLDEPDDNSHYADAVTYSTRAVVKNRKEISTGVKNILKRAAQLYSINWTPQKDIFGWNKEYVYKAGQTYSGLPYGQPVFAKYIPWNASFAEFLKAVDDPSSYMYTKYSYNSKIAPYYSTDCSAYISWAWQLNERHTTVGIPTKAILISRNSISQAKVGDALCKVGSHVVLIEDITYDANGEINSITVSESAPKKDTDLCCQLTSFGAGHELSLADFTQKYLYNSYYLYRNPKANEVTYKHYCEVIIDGDSCSKCKVGEIDYLRPFNTKLTVTAGKVYAYEKASDRSEIITSYAKSKKLTITGYGKNSFGELWYKTDKGYWVKGDGLNYSKLSSTINITDLSLPSGEISYESDPSIKGTVKADNLIRNIKAEVYSYSSLYKKTVLTAQTGKTSSDYKLKDSKLDSLLDLSALAPGKYRITLRVTEYAYSPFIKETVTSEKSFHSYFTVLDDPRCTSWSTKYPSLADEQFIEKERRYSYSDLVTVISDKSSLSGYTLKSSQWVTDDKGTVNGVSQWPSGFDKNHSLYNKYDISSLKASKTDTQKTTVSTGSTVGYIYYHWCENTTSSGPTNKNINSSKTAKFKVFHAFYSTKKPSEFKNIGSCYQYSNSSCCNHTYWYYSLKVNRVSYHNQSLEYTFTRWTPWSAWSATKYNSSDTRKTKTAIVYRYNDKIHTWDAGVAKTKSTCSTNGISVHNCSHCDMVKNQPLPLKDHTYSKQYTVDRPSSETVSGRESRHCTKCSATTDKRQIPMISSYKTSFKKIVYNGERQRPYLWVYDEDSKKLVYKTDYTVRYSSGSTQVGKYTVTVNFIGRYKGTKVLNYSIVPTSPERLRASQTQNSVTLKWKKHTDATGYRIYVYNPSSKTYKALKTTSATSYTHTNLKAGTNYTYVVKVYKKIGSDYFWSTASKIITSTKPVTPVITVKSTEKGTATVSWKKCADVSGYQVYIYNKDIDKYTKVSNSTQLKYTIKNLPSGKTQKIKVCAYKKVADGYVYSDFSTIKSVKVK